MLTVRIVWSCCVLSDTLVPGYMRFQVHDIFRHSLAFPPLRNGSRVRGEVCLAESSGNVGDSEYIEQGRNEKAGSILSLRPLEKGGPLSLGIDGKMM